MNLLVGSKLLISKNTLFGRALVRVRAKIEKNTLFGRALSNIHIHVYLYFLSSLLGARILTYLRWLLGFFSLCELHIVYGFI